MIPIAGAIQWLCGLLVALAILRAAPAEEPVSSRVYQGRRMLAGLAALLFVLAALELALARLGLPLVPLELRTPRWQLLLILAMSTAGWLALAVAGAWSGITSLRRGSSGEGGRLPARALVPRTRSEPR